MDIALILIICVLANNMGFVDAVGKVIHYDFRILSCVKCSTFWCVLSYLLLSQEPIIKSVAISFVMSYSALWVDLLIGCINRLYETIYDKITSEDNENKDFDFENTEDKMS